MTAIAVAGMHRTGTSMVAKSLRLAGLYLGQDEDLVEPAPDNPEGFYEHAGIVACNDDLLEATGGAWDHPPACPPMAADDPRVAEHADKARATLAPLTGAALWGWKDPRTSLTVRFWLDLVPELRVVVCVRHPLEVALSLKRRNQSSYARGLALWHAYYDDLLDAVPEDRRLVTHYDVLLADEGEELGRLLRFAGLGPDALDAARSAADAQLRHHQLDVTLAEAGVTRATVELYGRLCEEGRRPGETTRAGAVGPAHLDRAQLDLALARHQLVQNERHIASLREERAGLEARLTRLEAVVDGLGPLTQLDTRLDVLTATAHGLASPAAARRGDPVVEGCRELVHSYVDVGDSVLVVGKGDPALLDLPGRPAVNFPHDETRRYPGFSPADGWAAVAHLEALRLRGYRFLLVPETSRWWLDHYNSFALHLMGRHRGVADEPGTGLLVDLAARVGEEAPTLLAAVLTRIAGPAGAPPAVLDWTDQHLAARLPDANVFTPQAGGGDAPSPRPVLPYLDHSVDVVAVPVGADDECVGEARRVASRAVVTVDPAAMATHVLAVDGSLAEAAAEPIALLVDPGSEVRWRSQLRELVDGEPGVDVVEASRSAATMARLAGPLALVDEGVLPLPGWADAVRTTLAARPHAGAVAVCLFDAGGAIDAAGAVVFDDASWAGIAGGSYDVAAPWHAFVRPTCVAPGMAVLRPELAPATLGGPSAAAWAAALWRDGHSIVYQPEARAVRARGGGAGGPRRLDAEAGDAWAEALPSRPARPSPLDETAWRRLIARDDVEAGWR